MNRQIDENFKSPIIDAHSDALNFCVNRPENFMFREGAQLTLPLMEKAGIKIQVLAVCIDPAYKPAMAVQRTLQMITAFWDIIERFRPRVYPVLTKKDLLQGRGIGLLLALEGAEGLGGDPGLLKTFYRLGVRMLSLTWNHRNEFADGVGEREQNSRLTSAGRELVRLANQLGIVIDVSHLHESCFWDLLSFCRPPVIASHANARALADHPRNLTDKQLKAIAKSGGVVGVNFYPPFLGGDGAGADEVIRHMKYMCGVMGEDHVGLGGDFDGIEKTPPDLRNAGDLPGLFQKMAGCFTETECWKIMGENWLRVLAETLREEKS